MNHLQQTCADMLASQQKLHWLHAYNRALRREPKATPGLREQVRHGIAVHTEFLAVCGKALMIHHAANDAVNLPGAA